MVGEKLERGRGTRPLISDLLEEGYKRRVAKVSETKRGSAEGITPISVMRVNKEIEELSGRIAYIEKNTVAKEGLPQPINIKYGARNIKIRVLEGRKNVAASKRAELVKRLLSEADSYLAKGDAVRSSEKLYKAAKECIKALSESFGLEEVKAAEEKGRWTVTLLERAVRKLMDKLCIEVQLGWDAANHLHVWGFHEAKLEAEDVKGRMPVIKRLVELTEKASSATSPFA